MRFKEPITQFGLTKAEAQETRERYLKRNPGAMVTMERQEGSQLYMLITRLPLLSTAAMQSECAGWYKGWRN